MLLRCTTYEQSVDEKNLRTWLRNEIGDTDEETISRYVWENHRGSGVPYVLALEAIVHQTAEEAKTGKARRYVNILLENAKRPLELRQAETELLAWWGPRSKKAIDVVSRYKGEDREKAAREEYNDLIRDLVWRVHAIWPDRHRATVKGAVLAALVHENEKYTFEVAKLVNALVNPDPLAVNARASWSAEPS